MRYEYISFARGYAIFSILLFHALQRLALPGLWSKAIVFGGTGVHLFFLLSGFGLALSQTESTIDFFRRRFFRVWIPYFLALTISLALAITLHLFPDSWDAWLAGIGLYQMFFERHIESFGGHFWFVSAIMQFYIVFPVLKKSLDQSASLQRFVVAGLLMSVSWWILVMVLQKGAMRTWNSSFLQFLWEFMLGMAIAKSVKSRASEGRWMKIICHFWQPASWMWWLAGGVFFAGLMLLLELKAGVVGHIFNDIPALLGYGMLSVGVYFFSKRHLPFLAQFFFWVGTFSYSLYLVHIIALELTIRVLGLFQVPFQVVFIPVFVIFALLAGHIFEKGSQQGVTLFFAERQK